MNQNISSPFDQTAQWLFNLKLGFDFWHMFKIVYLVLFLFYFVFAFIIIRQVNLMVKALNGYFKLPIELIAWIHFFLVVGVFIFALITL